MDPETMITFRRPPVAPDSAKKCPDIPQLPTYRMPPPPEFWKKFPAARLPSHPSSLIDFRHLREIIDWFKPRMDCTQKLRADKVLHDLQHGSTVPFRSPLPAIHIPNTPSVEAHGEAFTDTLGWWIRQGYVAGPFVAPPLPFFRSNAMMAVEQREKIRIVMNLSAPAGESYNDAINELSLEKVSMSSARLFGYSVMDCGQGARMWKYDMQDAYKAVPAAQKDLRLQGFSWLGRYFVELKKVFGSKEAVSAFDRVNHTLVLIAAIIAKLPVGFIHRTLDDVPIVTPATSDKGKLFAEAYEDICSQIGAKLAPPCANLEKSFKDSKQGTVLGIKFDTDTLTWSISDEKKGRILSRIEGPLSGNHMTLLEVQRLTGSLNDVGQMCQFMRGFRQPLYSFLTSFEGNENISKPVPNSVREDLRIWAAALQTVAAEGFPIPPRPKSHLPSAICFASDASGAQFAKFKDKFITLPYQGERGAVSINCIEQEEIWFCAKITWPRPFLLKHRDSLDHAYGCKSSTLEAIGLILPLLCCPQILVNRQVTLLTDNEALVFGWERRRVAHDTSASIFLRAIHIISAYLGASIEIRHLPRISTPSAILADALTRSTTTTSEHEAMISSAPPVLIPQALLEWLDTPNEDWALALSLLDYVKTFFIPS